MSVKLKKSKTMEELKLNPDVPACLQVNTLKDCTKGRKFSCDGVRAMIEKVSELNPGALTITESRDGDGKIYAKFTDAGYELWENLITGSCKDVKIHEMPEKLTDEARERIMLEVGMKRFPNGFESWVETHHEIVKAITEYLDSGHKCETIWRRYEEQGTGGMYELGIELTDIFENKYKGREWDGEFFETIAEFMSTLE